MKSVSMIERIAALAELLDGNLQEKLWEYAQLLYVEQVAFAHEDFPSTGEPAPHVPSAAETFSDGSDDFSQNGWPATDSKPLVR